MLSPAKVRRYTNANDVSLYFNTKTGQEEVYIGLDRNDPGNQDLLYLSTVVNNAESEKETSPPASLIEQDDAPPSPLVLRRTLGGYPGQIAGEKSLFIDSQNQLLNGQFYDPKDRSNSDLKPASPLEKKSFSIFSQNNPNLEPSKKLDTYIEMMKKK